MMLKLERKFLHEVPAELSGLLEPVSDPETRVKLLNNPGKLQQLAALPVDAPLWVQIGPQDELAEAELKYVGPLTRGSSAVIFGVQLKGSAAGKGVSNGSYKGLRLFSCPEACGLFLPVSHIRLRRWSSRNNGADAQERVRERDRDHHQHRSNNNHPSNGHHSNDRPNHHQQQPSRPHQFPPASSQQPSSVAAVRHPPSNGGVGGTHHSPKPDSGPRPGVASAAPDRPAGVFPLDDGVHGGEVCFCGLLPGRSSSGVYVGVLLDAPVGSWDGLYKGERLCHIPNARYGQLLPINKVSLELKSHRHNQPSQIPKSILKHVPSAVTKPAPVLPPVSALKVALMPPSKLTVRPPPLPPPKPNLKPLPPLPPPKPHSPTSPGDAEQLQLHTNGVLGPPSPLRSPDYRGDTGENGEAGLEGELEVGSMVEVNDPPLFGVIRWIGRIGGILESVAGIELDQELSAGTDGSYLGERHFRCPANKGLFVKLRNCRRDSRFPAPETPVNQVERCNSIAFAEWGSERVEDHTPPPADGEEACEIYQGWKRGIQGHLNSCYLDATLFSLFSCCSSADWVLFWPSDAETDQTAQDLLRCEIVNPLRKYGYVCASKTMALRRLLEAANSDTGFTNQEKDPEEFLNKLFQLLRVEPLLKIRSMTQQPQECHLYQLFPPTLPPSSPTSPSLPLSPVDSPIPLVSPSSSRMRVASVQALLESSFLHAGLKFVEAPSCLLLLMPRFGKDFKMFDAILPTLSLDITDLLDDTLRQCSICQAVAEWECLQCYDDVDITPGHVKQYCETCNTQVHSHRKRLSHSPGEGRRPRGPVDRPSALHPPENVSLCRDVHRDEPLRELRQVRAARHRLAVFRQHGRPHRRRERLQHPSGEGVSGGGALPQRVGGGAEQSGPRLLTGARPPPALRLLHVSVPQPGAQPVQVTGDATSRAPNTIHAVQTTRTKPRTPGIMTSRRADDAFWVIVASVCASREERAANRKKLSHEEPNSNLASWIENRSITCETG
ncbi:Ubiquitin carboxyl-terminal hydrolase CYLD [Larimichthys crocea]|uniref:ubiquitinyl hydrolase 1 n=1 Tax=Larimichthys crocea TaxID=215358 RepID=A0A6G0HJH5_LARCR|nr:Ubiquitin carboxyl-terminal hydrolase CYLD [Larimichthys crocea]